MFATQLAAVPSLWAVQGIVSIMDDFGSLVPMPVPSYVHFMQQGDF